MEEDGHPLQRDHHQHGLLIRADWLTAGVARLPITMGLGDAHGPARREAMLSQSVLNELTDQILIHPKDIWWYRHLFVNPELSTGIPDDSVSLTGTVVI